MKLLLQATLFSIVLLPAVGSAATYNFGGNTDNKSSRTKTSDSLTLNIFGFDTDYNGLTNSGSASKINRNSANGWGINSNPAAGRLGKKEALVFDWGINIVTLTSGLLFERGNAPRERFDLYVDNILRLDNFKIPESAGNSFANLDFSSLSLSGSRFAFVGQTRTQNGPTNQGIRIKQLKVDLLPNIGNDPAAIPEPSILSLLGISLLGFRFANKKKQIH